MSEPGEPLDQLLQQNVDDYKKMVMRSLHDCRTKNLKLLSSQDDTRLVQIEPTLPAAIIDPQLKFPFWSDRNIADRQQHAFESVPA